MQFVPKRESQEVLYHGDYPGKGRLPTQMGLFGSRTLVAPLVSDVKAPLPISITKHTEFGAPQYEIHTKLLNEPIHITSETAAFIKQLCVWFENPTF